MSAHSADLSVIQQQDPVGIHDGRDALGHDDPGHIFVVPAQGCVESSFGYGDALALAAGQTHAALGDHGLVTIRHISNKGICLRGFRRFLYGFIGGIAVPETDIFSNGPVEEFALLDADRDFIAEGCLIPEADVSPCYGYRSFCGIVKARDQVDQGCFAAAGGTDDSKGFAGAERKADITENRPPGPGST